MSESESGGSANCRHVRFATAVYDPEAIKRAAYAISDRARVDINPTPDHIVCTLRPLKPTSEQEFQVIENDFAVEVLDQDLRQKIATETEAFRNLILSVAFSKTNLVT